MANYRNSQFSTQARRGVVLIMVMVLIVMVSLGAYSYTQLMTAQESSTAMSGRRLQARAALASGVEYFKQYTMMTPEDQATAGGHWDNPDYFQNVSVGGLDEEGLRFSIMSVLEDSYGEPTGIRFGLLDESSRLNVNNLVGGAYESQTEGAEADGLEGAGEEEAEEVDEFTESPAIDALMELPNMTVPIASAILDWIDEDDIQLPSGAESGAYSSMGYEPRNGPITSLDELLLVQGVTNELLYGADRNHNGILDPNEQTLGVGALGSMARGWSAYLTTNSIDAVTQAEETIDLNQEDLEALYKELTDAGFTEDFAKYVVVYRQYGPYTLEIPEEAPEGFEPPVPQPISSITPDFEQPGETEIGSVLELIDSSSLGSFPVPGQEEPKEALVESPYDEGSDLSEVLPMMMSLLTAGDEMGGSSGVNVNHCPSGVMAGLPGIDPNTVQNILQLQDRAGTTTDPNYQFPTWPLGVGAVSVAEMRQLMPYVAGNGRIFRAQIVGYSDTPGVFARAEVVIDASGESPQVLSWRDLSHLGLGFTLDTLTQ